MFVVIAINMRSKDDFIQKEPSQREFLWVTLFFMACGSFAYFQSANCLACRKPDNFAYSYCGIGDIVFRQKLFENNALNEYEAGNASN